MYDDDDFDLPSGERLSKVLAKRGLASRREAEKWIADGRVVVNGEVVLEQVFVDPEVDHIRVDDRPLPREPEKAYFLLYKPKGTITSREDPQGRKSVLSLLPDEAPRVEPVGRLDYDTEGALLLTNDGDLAHRLLHPSRKVPKRYLAKCYRTPDAKDLHALRTGVFLEDGRTQAAKVRMMEQTDTGNSWVEITVTEGRNRLIRRMFDKLGHPVSKLRRESFATISIRGLERGQCRPLTRAEVKRLEDIADGRRPEAAGKQRGQGFAKAKPKKKRHGQHKKGRGGPPRSKPGRGKR